LDYALAGDPKEARRQHARMVLAELGIPLDLPQTQPLAEVLVRLLGSPAGHLLRKMRPAASRRGEVYRLTLEGGFGPCVVEGRLDLLVEDGEGLLVVDFCTAKPHPQGLAPYAALLAAHVCYVQRALALDPETVAVRAGMVFLEEPEPTLHLGERLDEASACAALEPLVEGLLRLSPGTGAAVPGQPPARCAELLCGYRSRCAKGVAKV
jgi:hypothetical protein